jgi:hypothetical protein
MDSWYLDVQCDGNLSTRFSTLLTHFVNAYIFKSLDLSTYVGTLPYIHLSAFILAATSYVEWVRLRMIGKQGFGS